MKNKKQFKIFIVICMIALLIFIGLSYYLTLTDKNHTKEIGSLENEQTAVNLTKDDTAYQGIYPDYEIAYVYMLNTFSKQLTNVEQNAASKESFYKVVDDFEVLVNDFLEEVPDSPTTFQQSRDFAVSSALKTKTALKEYKQLTKENKLFQLEDKTSILNDAVADFQHSQETYKEVMETLN